MTTSKTVILEIDTIITNMPKYAKRKRTTRSNKNYERPDVTADKKAVICYCPQVCPDVMRVRMEYADGLALSGGGIAGLNVNVYRANSLFDPDFTGGGGQPLGRDQWAAFYRRYRVLACHVEWTPMADTSGVVFTCGITPLNTSGSLSSSQAYEAAAYTKRKAIGNTNATGVKKITFYSTTDKQRGMPYNGTRMNGELSALMGGNPIDAWYVHVWAKTDDGSLTWTVAGTVKLTYDVELYDRETLPVS